MYYLILGLISALVTVPIARKIKGSIAIAVVVSFVLPMLSLAIYILLLRDWKKKNTQTQNNQFR
jgi:LytS/YehU family sensor histidine kinase